MVLDMKLLAKLHSKTALITIAVICASCIILAALAILRYIVSALAPGTDINVNVGNNVICKVHYVENEVFGNEMMSSEHGYFMSSEHGYLMSFTDYIVVENTIMLKSSQVLNVPYQYAATETLVIKQRNAAANANPIVYEKKTLLSEQIDATAYADASDELGGVYVLEMGKHMEFFRMFVKEQKEQYALAQIDDVITDKALGFTAEIRFDFTYKVQIAEDNINETLASGCIIPLTSEVYSINLTNAPMLEFSIPTRAFQMPGLPTIVLISIWFLIHTIGLCYALRKLTIDNSGRHNEVKTIIRKYSDEIIFLAGPFDLSECLVIPVAHFQELLKLAVSFNKHIHCYHDGEKAEFCTFSNKYVYYWKI